MDSPTLGACLTPLYHPTQEPGLRGQPNVRLSIFWRLACGSLAIVIVMGGVNLYALFQLRELTSLSTQLVTYHYPAIEGAKHLLSTLYAQLRSEKKYLAIHDPEFVGHFKEEAGEFLRSLARLREAETSTRGAGVLEDVSRLQEEYRTEFLSAVEAIPSGEPATDALQRETLIDRTTAALQSYISFHEAKVSTGVSDSRASSARAEDVTRQLILLALLIALGFAGMVSYSILRPLRRLQTRIQGIGQGKFGTTVEVQAPSDLDELVEAVNWMAKKLQELDEMKSEFIAHISHELRTPLASIKEGTQLLLDEIPGPLSRDQREALRIMAESSHRLIHLISTLLDLSKMEAGMMEYRIVLTDLKLVAETSLSKIRLLADAKHVQILLEAPRSPLWVPADGARIEQVGEDRAGARQSIVQRGEIQPAGRRRPSPSAAGSQRRDLARLRGGCWTRNRT